MLQVDFEIAHTHHLSRFQNFFERNFSKDEFKALNNLVKNKDIVIQKADEDNNIVILSRSDYISKLSNILEDTSRFKRVNIKEGKAFNHLIHITHLLKSTEISQKEKIIYIHQVPNQ